MFKISITNKYELDEAVTAIAEMETVFEIMCLLPTFKTRRSVAESSTDDYIARGYHVSVSNDGVTYSDEDVLVIYDSTCVSCTVDISTITCDVQVRTLITLFSYY